MIAGLVLVLVAGVVVYALIVGGSRPTGQVGRRGHVDREFVSQKWQTISQMAATGSGLKSAVSEADKLVDYVLRQSGVPGQTMGERLKRSDRRFSDINAIWRAHKLRNALAHDVQFDLVASQAREALRDFERGLRDLGAL